MINQSEGKSSWLNTTFCWFFFPKFLSSFFPPLLSFLSSLFSLFLFFCELKPKYYELRSFDNPTLSLNSLFFPFLPYPYSAAFLSSFVCNIVSFYFPIQSALTSFFLTIFCWACVS